MVTERVASLVWLLCLLSVLVSGEDVAVTVYVEPNGSASCVGSTGVLTAPVRLSSMP